MDIMRSADAAARQFCPFPQQIWSAAKEAIAENFDSYLQIYRVWRFRMKLYFLFAMMDVLILLAYPVIFMAYLFRKLWKSKQ